MGVAVAYRPIVKRTEEQDLHRAVVELLTWAAVKGLVWYHVPNGELRPGRTGAPPAWASGQASPISPRCYPVVDRPSWSSRAPRAGCPRPSGNFVPPVWPPVNDVVRTN